MFEENFKEENSSLIRNKVSWPSVPEVIITFQVNQRKIKLGGTKKTREKIFREKRKRNERT